MVTELKALSTLRAYMYDEITLEEFKKRKEVTREVEDGLPIYVVYENPSDYPGKFVVRKQVAVPGHVIPFASPQYVGDSLDDARACIPEGLYRMGRRPEDDPVIVETWF